MESEKQYVEREQEPDGLAAVLSLSAGAMRELLQLPAGAYVDAAFMDAERLGTIRLRVRGAGWPVRPGDYIPRCTASCRQTFDEQGNRTAFVLDWGFPK